MSTITDKHAKILAMIENEPEYKRKKAEERFLIIKDFLSDFEKAEIKKRGESFSRRQAIINYCLLWSLPFVAFTKWLQNYEAKGIRGLLPSYGNRKGCSPYVKDVLPIIAEIIKPGQSMADLHRQLLPICKQMGIVLPSAKTLSRMVKASGLSTRKIKQRVISTVNVTLNVDTQNPLNSLMQLSEFIRNTPSISPAVKEHSTTLLRKTLKIVSRKSPLSLSRPLTSDEIRRLIRYRSGQHKRHSAIATALMMINESALLVDVVNMIGCHPGTVLAWVKKFHDVGIDFIEVKPHHPKRTERLAQREARIIDIIHTPPTAYNINRTTWTYGTITDVYFSRYHERISTKTVERSVKKSGCTWRRLRNVQTSPDPEYRAKVEKLLDTLQGLKEGERFFFIDEVGPYRVKKYGGTILMPKGQTQEVPENQKSRGKIQFVAALEAVTNQMLWNFSPDKTAASMIRLFEKIALEYADCPALFFTWDAISAHGSKVVTEWIKTHNTSAKGPHIEVVPLPSNAQFLNVIEAVFGGMKKAVICNSDYPTAHDMQEAIARHFEDRNQYYRDNPKRAGNKIWDKQKFDFDKLAGGLFKKM